MDQLPQIDAWREAYRGFGAKPQRTRNSLEALTRRAASGLPRVNALTDIYNAISVVHQIPIGGEDFDLYDGPALLTRASGDEAFDTVAAGEPTIENPDAGEVIWRDGTGVTCRRWNWRQGRRTALSENTTTAFFILDALAPMSDTRLEAAGEALGQAMQSLGAAVQVSQRIAGAQ
ncbi:phenylalanine--tRNA ligase beta subunit-related protein [Glutamicibacter halophytocola]|uniref:B3/B4 domain-containing protein n=1 Tax=Glutamicibacter halophytocola TaxID=1933880 RepID=UPI00321A3019